MFLFFGRRQKRQNMAVLLFHKPLSSFDHFAWKFRVLEFGYLTSVFTVTFGCFSEVVGCLFYYLFLQSNWRFSIFFAQFLSFITSGGKQITTNFKVKIRRYSASNSPDEMVMDDKQLCAFSATRNGKTFLSERGCKNFRQACELA